MNVRNIKLINSEGQAYMLTTQEHFIHEISGFGFTDQTALQRVGSLLRPLTEVLTPDSPTGFIFFPEPNAYQKYYEFARFIRRTPLRLLYNPNGEQEYMMDVRVQSLEKADLVEGHTGLNCAVTFVPLSAWYREVIAINDGTVGDGKVYNYTYDYMYTDSVRQTIKIDSDSDLESPSRITIYGPVEDPVWVHYVNNVQKATGTIDAEIPAGHKLVIDTTTIPYSIKEFSNEGTLIADRYQQADFSTDRFFFLDYGENRISVQHYGANTVTLGVEAHLSYETV